MKICYVDEDGRFGGPQQRMLLCAEQIKKFNHLVEFIIPKADADLFKKKIKLSKFSVIELALTRLTFQKIYLIKYIIFFFYEIYILVQIFKKKKYNLIQANSTPQFKAIIASRILGIPCIWVIEDSYFPKIIFYIFKFLAKITRCGLIYTSNSVFNFYFKGNFLKKNFKKKIYAPVDSTIFNPKKKHQNFSLKKQIIISTVAGIVPVKGIEFFIEMANILEKENFFFKYLIAGGEIESQKKYSIKIKKLIKQSSADIRLVGMVDDVPNFLNHTDIFVCSSISEAGPITVYEAMMMKKPVITTNVGACNEIIDNYKSGIITPTKDSLALARAVRYLINNPNLVKTMSSKAHDISKFLFCSKKIGYKYLETYNQFINERNKNL